MLLYLTSKQTIQLQATIQTLLQEHENLERSFSKEELILITELLHEMNKAIDLQEKLDKGADKKT